jgi:GH25 family lysozyme M1 (1,4-beta-N-acetylmuramidase)
MTWCRLRQAMVVLFAAAVMAVVIPTPASAQAMLTGVDVASWQHPGGAPIDWAKVRGAGHSFAFVKASEGTNYRNPYFAQDWKGSAAAGLYRGAYHYARPALPLDTATAQARYFAATIGPMGGALDLPAVLDLEETGGLGPADLAQWARVFLAETERLTGRAPIVYTGFYFWRDKVGNPTDIGAKYRLWLASYPSDPNSTTFRPLVPSSWSAWTFWQYTDRGTVPGIPSPGAVDINRFCCDLASLAALGGRSPASSNPFGNFEAATVNADGTVSASGWVIDPDTAAPIDVHFYANGAWAGAHRAGQSRPDVGAAYPAAGPDHGFRATVALGAGTQDLCAYAINTGPGTTNPLVGCRRVQVPVTAPVGRLDAASAVVGAVRMQGWAIDFDSPDPVDVHLYVDGRFAAVARAGGVRSDVNSLFGMSRGTGFDTTVVTGSGRRQVCAYAINVGRGWTNPLLGCRDVEVRAEPVGNLESVTRSGSTVTVTGWALDPDTAAPIDVHVYANGVGAGAATAGRFRPDVGAVYPAYGPAHGFRVDVTVGAGPQTVCVYAINAAAGTFNPLLRCQTV